MKIKKNLKEILVRLYENSVRKAFNLWNNGQYHLMRTKQSETITDLNAKGTSLTTDVTKTTKAVNNEKDRQARNARTGLNRASEIWYTRSVRYGLHKWHERC